MCAVFDCPRCAAAIREASRLGAQAQGDDEAALAALAPTVTQASEAAAVHPGWLAGQWQLRGRSRSYR